MKKKQLTQLDLGPIWNCQHSFEMTCPQDWNSLEKTDNDDVRFCNVCTKNVTYCHSPDKFVELGMQGECVAVPEQASTGFLYTCILGRPSQSELAQLESRERKATAWWKKVLEKNPSFELEAMKIISESTLLNDQPNNPITNELSTNKELQEKFQVAFKKGPIATYQLIRETPFFQKNEKQKIYKILRLLFDINYEDFRQITKRDDLG